MRLPSLLLALLLSGSATIAQMLPSAAQGQASRATLPADAIRCVEEADCLWHLKGRVERSGDVLRLKLEDGKTKELASNKKACEEHDTSQCLVQRLAAYLPTQQFYIVDVEIYESSRTAVVNARTGEEAILHTAPHFSPDGRWFVAADESADHDVAIWVTIPHPNLSFGPYQVFLHDGLGIESPARGWEFLAWEGNNRVRLKVFVFVDGETKQVETDAVLTDWGWKLNFPEIKQKTP